MSDKYFVGSDLFSSSNNGKYKPVSRITLKVDDSKVITAGDDTGFELIADCPHATQDIADSLLSSLKGIEYQTFSADGVNINPSAELGDGVTVRGIYSVLSMMRDDGTGYPSVEAPGKAEDEDEYPAGGPMTQEFERQLASTRSLISKTSEEIRLEIQGLEGNIGTLELTTQSLTGRIEDAEGNIGTLELAADELRSEISGKIDGEYAQSLIDQSLEDITLSISNNKGSTTFTIKGGGAELTSETFDIHVKNVNIEGKLNVDQLNLTGAITFGDLDEDTQLAISDAYNMALENQLPSYIQSTYIDSVSIQSPTIVGGTFIGNEFNAIAEYSGGGSFNLYGKYSNHSVHALSISYAAGIAPDVYIGTPAGGSIYIDSHMYVEGDIDVGLNDIYYNAGSGVVASLRELDGRVTALEAK